MIVELLSPNISSFVEQFVQQCTEGKIGYIPAWSEMVNGALKHKTIYFVARDGDVVHGVLPLAYIRSKIFGNRLISQALSTYGGILADSPQVEKMLFDEAVEFATKYNCESIEFRNIKPLPFKLDPRSGKMCMHLLLSPDPEEIWKSFNPKVRNQVRKAEKSNIAIISGGVELLREFYRVYTVRMRQLGTPCYPISVMETILRQMPDKSRVFIAQIGNLVIGGGFTVSFNGFVEIPWASTLVEYNPLCPNNLLYWSVIKHYCLAGAKIFDFGRCTINGPTYHFKKQWDPEPVELHYQYWVHPKHGLKLLSPENPNFKRKVEMWKRLPLWSTRILGPMISRNLP